MLFIIGIVCVYSTPLIWEKKVKFNSGLPQGLQIFSTQTNSSPFGTKLTASFLQFNTHYPFQINTVISQVNLKTPPQFAQQYPGTWAVINGGFFNMQTNMSMNFAASKSRVLTTNKINEDQTHHPTIGTFGRTDNGYEFKWIYSFGQNKQTYWFLEPNKIPGPKPSQRYGSKWQPIQGLSGGPMLIKQGIIQDLFKENFGYYIISERHPVIMHNQRSAICKTNRNSIIMFAVDGRYQKSEGLNLAELGYLLKQLGCMDALNLDGGGSTLLYANNQIINHPSQYPYRPVASALILKSFQSK